MCRAMQLKDEASLFFLWKESLTLSEEDSDASSAQDVELKREVRGSNSKSGRAG